MWICVMGAEGSGKNVIADILTKRNFQRIEHKLADGQEGELFQEFNYMTKRLSEQLAAQAVMQKQDVFTFRSIWDSYNVMLPTAKDSFKIGMHEELFMDILHNNISSSEHLQPPHCVVFTKMSQQDIRDRMMLKGKQPSDDEIVNQIKYYEQFMSRIRVPVLEIDMNNKPEDVRNELNFSIDSMKATAQSAQSIWRRSMFF